MVIMALDHVRDYTNTGYMFADPANLETTTPALFFTRWITHFCAPVFVFLAGTSAFLYGNKYQSKNNFMSIDKISDLRNFLLKSYAEQFLVTDAVDARLI